MSGNDTYALLANRFGISDILEPPRIERVGLYLARHATLVCFDLDELIDPAQRDRVLDGILDAGDPSGLAASP